LKRIQKKGYYDYSWQSNPNAVYVGRPSKYGNPFKLTKEEDRKLVIDSYRYWLEQQLLKDPYFLNELRGKDLVCFCPLDKLCHADILIEYVEKIKCIV
jgi:hypothetical protein